MADTKNAPDNVTVLQITIAVVVASDPAHVAGDPMAVRRTSSNSERALRINNPCQFEADDFYVGQ